MMKRNLSYGAVALVVCLSCVQFWRAISFIILYSTQKRVGTN